MTDFQCAQHSAPERKQLTFAQTLLDSFLSAFLSAFLSELIGDGHGFGLKRFAADLPDALFQQ